MHCIITYILMVTFLVLLKQFFNNDFFLLLKKDPENMITAESYQHIFNWIIIYLCLCKSRYKILFLTFQYFSCIITMIG